MLGSLLGAHPRGVSLPESQFKVEAMRGGVIDASAKTRAHRLRHLLRSHRFTGWHQAFSKVKAEDLEEASYRQQIDLLVSAYIATIGKEDADFVVDDTPSNKNFFLTLSELYPEARFIHIIRDGRAVANSVLQRDWGPNTSLLAAYWWQYHLAHGLAAEKSLGPERVLRVRYEDVLDDPQGELAKICSWHGIEYSERMLEPVANTLDVRAAAFNPLAKRGPQPERAHAWRDTLSSRQVEVFESATGDMLSYLGYETHFGAGARSASKRELVLAGAKELIKGAINIPLYYFRRQWLKHRVASE
jgi:hypothetical protein